MRKIPHLARKDVKVDMVSISLKFKLSAIKTYKQSFWSPSTIFLFSSVSPPPPFVFPTFSLQQSGEQEEIAGFSTEYVVF